MGSSKELMNNIQQNLQCCGAMKGAEDYNTKAPAECEYFKHKPCSTELFNIFGRNLVLIISLAVGVGAVMIIGLTFSLFLCCAIRKNYGEQQYAKIIAGSDYSRRC